MSMICILLFLCIFIFSQLNFVGKYLTGIEGYKMVDSQSLRKFVNGFLHQDGVFLLRMVATHAGELSCYELAKKLWTNFCDNKEGKVHDVWSRDSFIQTGYCHGLHFDRSSTALFWWSFFLWTSPRPWTGLGFYPSFHLHDWSNKSGLYSCKTLFCEDCFNKKTNFW